MLLYLLRVIILAGVLLWAIESLPATAGSMKTLARVVIVGLVICWLVAVFFKVDPLGIAEWVPVRRAG